MVNKKQIQRNFDQKTIAYENFALMQKQAAVDLCLLFEKYLKDKSLILDLGSGPSFISKNLTKKVDKIFEIDIALNMLKSWLNRPSNAIAIQADIANLPFKNKEIFDVIFSSFALQWLKEDLNKIFANLYNNLNNLGYIVICIPTYDSLVEIRTSSQKSGCNFYIKDLPKNADLIKALQNANFSIINNENKVIKKTYINAFTALKTIKNIGANYSDSNNLTKKFITKIKLKKFNDFFAQNFNNQTSWHLTFIIAQKNIF